MAPVTVLSILQRAAYQLNIRPPTAIVGATDAATLQLTNLFYSVCEEIRTKRYWPQLKRTYTFQTADNREYYPLPQDFYAAVPGTQWDASNKWEMLGPMTSNQFAYRLYGYVTSENRTAYMIEGPDFNPNTGGGQFRINPIPGTGGGGSDLTFQYISGNYIFPPNWTPSTVIPASSYRNANGKIFFTTAGGTTSSTPPNAAGADGTVTWTLFDGVYETVFNNADICLFDASLVINGLRAFYAEQKGLDGAEARDRFSREIDVAFARFLQINKLSLNGTGLSLSGLNPNIGDGNFGS